MTAARKIGVHEEFLAVPDTKIAQVVAGELHVHPRPRAIHAMVSSGLTGELLGPFQRGRGDGPGGWILLYEPELHLGGDILVPDLAGWRRTRMPEMPDVAFFDLAPDWICEVLSPSTAKLDRGKKLSAYGREGVPVVWFIDPDAHTLEVLTRGDDGRYTLAAVHSDDEIVHAVPFEVFALELSVLWAR